MFEFFSNMFSYTFMIRAVIVGLLISVCASLLGVNLVLKRFSMIGDGLSHVGFAALAGAAAAGIAPLKVAIPVCIAAAVILLKINGNSRIKGDSAIALLCSGALAIGVMILSLSSGMNTDVNNYMFGSILSLKSDDTVICIVLSIVVIVLYVLFSNRIFAITFDETFAKATGTKVDFFNMLLSILTAVTVVIGMRMMGALLISSLIIFPALTAMRISKKYSNVIIISVILSVVCFMTGISISFGADTPTGASIVCVDIVIFAAFSIIGKIRKKNKCFSVKRF